MDENPKCVYCGLPISESDYYEITGGRPMHEDAEKCVVLLVAELAAVRAESESRRVALLEKADEAKREWTRAERAEGEVERLRDALTDLHSFARGRIGLYEQSATYDKVKATLAAK